MESERLAAFVAWLRMERHLAEARHGEQDARVQALTDALRALAWTRQEDRA